MACTFGPRGRSLSGTATSTGVAPGRGSHCTLLVDLAWRDAIHEPAVSALARQGSYLRRRGRSPCLHGGSGRPHCQATGIVGIGSLLNSNGAAIGISVGLALGGTVITRIVSNNVSATVAAYLITESSDIVASLNRHGDIPLYAATIATAVWLTAFLGAGLWRTLHDEY